MFLRYAKIAITLCGFLVAIEICARTDDFIAYSAPFWAQYNPEILRAVDKDNLPINVPNAQFEKWRHNNLGFRGPDITILARPGTTRVVCLGASESYGLHESQGKEWPAQLQEILPSPEIQVINASRAGLGFGSFQPYIDKYILPLHPDKIVLLINPLFYFDNLEKSRNVKKPLTRPSLSRDEHSRLQIMVENCRSLPKIKNTVKSAFTTNFPTILERYQTWNLMRQLRSLEVGKLKGAKSKDEVSEAYLDCLKEDLTKLVLSLKQQKIDVVLCTYPSLVNKENIGRYPVVFFDLRRFFPQYSHEGLVAAIADFNKTIVTVATALNVKLVDGEKAVPKTLEFFGDAVHYTDLGANNFAAAVSRQIIPEQQSTVEIPIQGIRK